VAKDQDGTREQASRRRFFTGGGMAAIGAAGVLASAAGAAFAQQTAAQSPVSDFAWGDAIKRIKTAGKLVVAQSGSPVPPQYYRDPKTNEPAGYDAEIARMIAKDLDVEPVFEEAIVAARVTGLQAGKYDIVLGGTANTPARALSVAFTRGYIPYQQVLLVHADSPIKDVDQLNDPKYTITTMIGSTAEYAARQRFPKANIKPLKINEAMLEVAAGRADADLVELYLAGPFAKIQPSTKVLGGVDKPIITATEYGCIVCRASDMGFREWLDNWLYWYDSHGIIDGLYERIMGPALRGESTR
jgi:ABC-type amino acid transport substrate-binding protein